MQYTFTISLLGTKSPLAKPLLLPAVSLLSSCFPANYILPGFLVIENSLLELMNKCLSAFVGKDMASSKILKMDHKIMANHKQSMSQKCNAAAKKANAILGYIGFNPMIEFCAY